MVSDAANKLGGNIAEALFKALPPASYKESLLQDMKDDWVLIAEEILKFMHFDKDSSNNIKIKTSGSVSITGSTVDINKPGA